MSQFDSESAQEGDQVDRVEDVQPAKDVFTGDVRSPGIADQLRSSDLVGDLTLAQGLRYTPAGLRVLRTSYVFRVNELVRGSTAGEYVTINDTGGVYPDGSSVSTENSFRLNPGERYMVFADRVGEDLWLRQVLQIHGDGDVVADASGRVLVESREGLPIAQATPTYEPLRYVRTAARPVEPMEGPPDEVSVPLPARSEAAAVARQGALSLQAVVQYLRARNREPSPPEGVQPPVTKRTIPMRRHRRHDSHQRILRRRVRSRRVALRARALPERFSWVVTSPLSRATFTSCPMTTTGRGPATAAEVGTSSSTTAWACSRTRSPHPTASPFATGCRWPTITKTMSGSCRIPR